MTETIEPISPASDGTASLRGLLFHGTSTARLKRILEENCLRRAPCGHRVVSFTPARNVADYFGCLAANADRSRPGSGIVPITPDAAPVVLVFDADMLASKYNLVPYSDGDEYAYERELCSRRSIRPVRGMLTAVEHLDLSRLADYRQHRRAAFGRTPFLEAA